MVRTGLEEYVALRFSSKSNAARAEFKMMMGFPKAWIYIMSPVGQKTSETAYQSRSIYEPYTCRHSAYVRHGVDVGSDVTPPNHDVFGPGGNGKRRFLVLRDMPTHIYEKGMTIRAMRMEAGSRLRGVI